MICHPLDDEEAEKLLEEQELLYASKSIVNSGQFPDLSYLKPEQFYRAIFNILQTKEPVQDKGNRRKVE